jgi:glycosyltransferase involved in cell wall biosynthesis
MICARPTLTIAIPTFNRASYLRHTLERIQEQRFAIGTDRIELLVCDNHSEDSTPDVLRAVQALDPSIRITRHNTNIGPDHNIATSFMLARGRYVWILGDDDFPVDGLLVGLIPILEKSDYGLVYLKPYGYDTDPIAERPFSLGSEHEYANLATFLYRVGAHLTFISSILVYKDFLEKHDFLAGEANNLLQVEIYLAAAERSSKYLYISRYSVACKRNNSGGYDFTEVFVERLNVVIDRHLQHGRPAAARALRNAIMLRYYPQYILFMRLRRDKKAQENYSKFKKCYNKNAIFWIVIAPIFALPRWAAIAWGGCWTFLGRGLGGDMMRGIQFAYNGLKRSLFAWKSTSY